MWKLEKGDIVKCIIADAGELTLDKEYEILDVDTSISHVEVLAWLRLLMIMEKK